MEQLSETLAASFQISSNPNDTTSPHPRLSEYKIKPSNIPDQHTRRQRMLQEQKKRRQDRVNYARSLAEGDEMEVEESNKRDAKKKPPTFEKCRNPHKNQLMLSEWLVDLPVNFEQDWIMVISPIGKRCLVVASRSNTAVYTKSGYRVNRFPSLLPGGSRESFRPSEYTILDCIFSEINRTFYIIDVMCWRGHPVYDSETEFRFYWLKTKLSEHPELLDTHKNNPYKFVAADISPCDHQSIYNALLREKPYQVDGVLFYHKQAHYDPGNTPLVGWLKVYMIPEITGVCVPDEFLHNVPEVHKLTLAKENEKIRERDNKLRGEKKKGEDEMEVEQQKRSGKKKAKGKEMVVDESSEAEGKNLVEMQQ